MLRAGVVAALASSAAMVAVLFVGSQWLQLVEGWSPLQSGVALLPLAVGAMVASPFAPALAERTSPRIVLSGGLLVLSAGLGLLAVVPATYPWIAVAFAVVGLGTSALGLGSALIMGAATEDQAGSAAAVEEITYELGAVLGITFLGSLVGAVYRAGLPAGASGEVRESVAGCRRRTVVRRGRRRVRDRLRVGRGGGCRAHRAVGVRRVAAGPGRPHPGRRAPLTCRSFL